MSLKEQKDDLVKFADDHKRRLGHNHKLFNIFEGDLLTYVVEDMRKQLDGQAFEQAITRVAPINVLRKIIDRLSKIYQQVVVRTVDDGTDTDSELLSWYIDSMQVNFKLNIYNEFYNLFKNSIIHPFVNKGKPQLRVIPSDRFIPYSDDIIDPTNPTHMIIIEGETKNHRGDNKVVYQIWSDDEFIIVDSDNNILQKQMDSIGNPDGINPYGKLPFIYTNQSSNLLIPKVDTDILALTKLIPVLLTDLNFAVKFQSFSIIYGIDIDDEHIKLSPNSFWRFKSDPTSDKPSQLGTIKPQVDIDQVLGLIQSELAFWLNSKGIRPGSVGSLSSESFASGISKMVDEMDTVEERRKQVQVFKSAEESMWDLIMNYMHPAWVSSGMVENNALFTPTASVDVMFPEQLPLINRKDLIDELRMEVEAGFTSKRKAIKTLNPKMTDLELDAHIEQIEDEKSITIVSE